MVTVTVIYTALQSLQTQRKTEDATDRWQHLLNFCSADLHSRSHTVAAAAKPAIMTNIALKQQ